MTSRTACVTAALCAIALSGASTAWAQRAPWSAPGVQPAPSVLSVHAPLSPDADRDPLAASSAATRVALQASMGYVVGAGGGVALGLVVLVPSILSNNNTLMFSSVYAGWALAASGAVYHLGQRTGGGGSFAATLIGASCGAAASGLLHGYAFNQARGPEVIGVMALMGLLTTTGAVLGNALTSSSVDARASRRSARLSPTVDLAPNGVVLGIAGTMM